MSDNSSNNKRIAKNTILLYLRMLFTMAVTLYTSRVILNTLGVKDFGIYNVAGGVISMFAFINASMSSATQRFITFTLGKNDQEELNKVFSTSLQIHAIISIIILLLGETVGLWFLLEKLIIPESRMVAAMWVYQCSIAITIINIMSVPYNADIIAHEKMSAFAYISVLEVVLKLLVVYLLVISPIDKLIAYAVLLLLIQLLIRFVYAKYCAQHFQESKYRHGYNPSLFREMSSFAGWSFFGNFSAVLYGQGLNILLNLFFGPVINAARGIAVQVQNAVMLFVTNFQTALNPQITKTFASGQLEQMHSLMFRSARFSYYLLYLLTLPVLLETDYIITLWLKNVPDNTVVFLRIMLCSSLITTFSNPCAIANQATGEVKKYQIIVGGLLLLVLPLSYIALLLGMPAYSVFIIQILVECVAQFARMFLLRKLINLPLHRYFPNVIYPILAVSVIAILIPFYIHFNMSEGILRFLFVGFMSVIMVGITSFAIGLTNAEKSVIVSKVQKILRK